MSDLAGPPISRAAAGPRLIRLALAAVAAGLVYMMFVRHGNTTSVGIYSSSAFGWMVIFWNYTQGWGGVNYVQGWLFPLVSLWLAWRKRADLAAAAKRVSWAGLAVVGLAILLHWIGAKSQQTRLSLFAFILLVWGIPFFLYGRRVAGLLAFPAAFLIFCIPLNFLDGALFPLRIASVRVAAGLLTGLGVNIVAQGTALLPAQRDGLLVDAADAAGGISVLVTVVAFAAVWAHLALRRWWRQAALLALAVPLALLANIVRLLIVVLAAQGLGAESGRVLLRTGISCLLTYSAAFALVVGAGMLLRHMGRQQISAWTRHLTARSSS